MIKKLCTRFAPSPTGHLHLGHIASALYVWGVGRACGAKIILRIEDHDRGRSRKEYEESILRDLEWLGFEPDLGVSSVDKKSPFRQSDCLESYASELKKLQREGVIFACACSRKQILEKMPAGDHQEVSELFYPGTCRKLSLQEGPELGLRLRLETSEERFNDLLLGPQIQCPAKQCGDLLLKDRHQNWTYHFAVCVDDFKQGVDLVVRGQDLTSATGRQLYLARKLGRTSQPDYFHHPLIFETPGVKLSKRLLSQAITQYRIDGASRQTVLLAASQAVGLAKNEQTSEVSLNSIRDQLAPLINKSN